MEPFNRRRALLAAGGGGALLLAGCGRRDSIDREIAGEVTEEAELLADLLALERRSIDFFAAGIRFADAKTDRVLRQMREVSLDHIETLTGMIAAAGGPPPGRGKIGPQPFVRDSVTAIAAAKEITSALIESYREAIPQVADRGRRRNLMTMLAVEAEQLTAITGRAVLVLPGAEPPSPGKRAAEDSGDE